MKIYTVSELNIEAREVILLAFEYPISVKGEITDYRSSRGHQYFKLRDSSKSYTIECVVWKNSINKLNIADFLDMEVVATAKVDFYAGFGKFQLNIIEISEFGDGFLKQEIEKLKQKLSNEGIFDQNRDLPYLPKNIGIITAKDSHALKDVCSKINERYPMADIYVYPSTVQGSSAPLNLIRQLRKANKDRIVDLLLIVRGGGSLQDLMAFNDEKLVREIAKSSIKTITGIGHKPDITLADYASDSTQETPTAAAVKAVPDSIVILQDICHTETSINNNLKQKINILTDKINNISSILKANAPNNKLKTFYKDLNINVQLLKKTINGIIKKHQTLLVNENSSQKRLLDTLKNKNNASLKNIEIYSRVIERNTLNKLNQLQEILRLKLAQINQSNPRNILEKGYAIIRDSRDIIIKSTKIAETRTDLKVEMIDGQFEVFRKKKKDLI